MRGEKTKSGGMKREALPLVIVVSQNISRGKTGNGNGSLGITSPVNLCRVRQDSIWSAARRRGDILGLMNLETYFAGKMTLTRN